MLFYFITRWPTCISYDFFTFYSYQHLLVPKNLKTSISWMQENVWSHQDLYGVHTEHMVCPLLNLAWLVQSCLKQLLAWPSTAVGLARPSSSKACPFASLVVTMSMMLLKCQIYVYLQLESEWRNNGRKKALPGLDEIAKKEINWEQLEQLASEDKLTLYGGLGNNK